MNSLFGRLSTAIQKCTYKDAKWFGRYYIVGSVPGTCHRLSWATEKEALDAILADPWIQANPNQMIQLADCSTYDRSKPLPPKLGPTTIERYRENLGKYGNEIRAAKATMKEISKEEAARLEALAKEATFTVRRYDRQFYSWAYHPRLSQPRDPWPASKWPLPVLCIEFAKD